MIFSGGLRALLKRLPILGLSIAFSFGPSRAEKVVYRIDSTRSIVGFELQATAHKVHGQTHAVHGLIRLPEHMDQDTLQVAAKIEIAAGELVTGNGRRDRRMHEETLDVRRYPSIRFDLERIVGKLDQLQTGKPVVVTLKGKLSIRDVTREVLMKGRIQLDAGELKVQGQYALRFTDYNVPDPSILFLRVQKDMIATFSIVCVSKTLNGARPAVQ